MPHDSNSNAPSSARTSIKPPATPLSESQFLTQQQEEAKKAISRSLDGLKSDLVHAADPRAWMRTNPWITLCASAVAGFTASAAMVPSKDQQALKRLEQLEEAVARAEHPEVFDKKTAAKAKSGGLGIQGLIYRVIQPMIVSTLTGFLSGKAAAPASPTGGNEPGMEAVAPEPAVTGADPGI